MYLFRSTQIKFAVILTVCLGWYNVLVAQVPAETDSSEWEQYRAKFEADYNSYRQLDADEYASFRRLANTEYARYVQEAWSEAIVTKPSRQKSYPKPVTPYVSLGGSPGSSIPIRVGEVKRLSLENENINVPPIPLPIEIEPKLMVVYYGTPFILHVDGGLKIHLETNDGVGVSKVWKKLSSREYDGMLHDCLEIKKNNRLCDWAYIEFTGVVARTFLGDSCNEAVVLQLYLLTQSGYSARIAKIGERLMLLVPFKEKLYDYCYLLRYGQRFYVMEKNGIQEGEECEVCDVAFPGEKVASILMAELPNLQSERTAPHRFKPIIPLSDPYELRTNRNLIDFLNNYPATDTWKLYACASFSEEMKQMLYPKIKRAIHGMDYLKSVETILGWIQHVFDYMTDQEQFGYERPLFADESFYYPFNDCEDRSIVFSILVRELVGLDVVLLEYSGHMATAVSFASNVKGDYIEVDDKKWVVCDPTYIGAGVGESMPLPDENGVKVIFIN